MWGRNVSLLGEIGTGEDEIILLGRKRFAEDEGIQPGDPASAGWKGSHRLDVSELIGCPPRWRSRKGGRRRIAVVHGIGIGDPPPPPSSASASVRTGEGEMVVDLFDEAGRRRRLVATIQIQIVRVATAAAAAANTA